MGDLYIRNYVRSDIAQVMELQNKYSRIYTEVPICTDDNLRHPAHPVYEEGKNIFCGFDSKDKMIAYASIFPRPVDDDLIMKGLNYLAQHGLREARLEVMSKNRNALTLYESMGYIVNREEKVFGRNVRDR
ncbi:hypothetical protein [Desulfosporosinus sp. FKA]|uniref:GNAT family N-acetyltransferase n=1 Tax=Desulfosporosinus sp. FKA TaxID=1969834 RepID=UPI000B499B47|nr:hypothetical protein [Desulfosporosinus sp. FKA]